MSWLLYETNHELYVGSYKKSDETIYSGDLVLRPFCTLKTRDRALPFDTKFGADMAKQLLEDRHNLKLEIEENNDEV